MKRNEVLSILENAGTWLYNVVTTHDLSTHTLPAALTETPDVIALIEELTWHKERTMSDYNKLMASVLTLQHKGVDRLSDSVIEKQEIGLSLNRRPLILLDIMEEDRYAKIRKEEYIPDGFELSAYFNELKKQADGDDSWQAQLWLSALEHTFNQFDPKSFKQCPLFLKGRLRGLCKAWFDYSMFSADIKKATNYQHACRQYTHGINAANTPFTPTGMYYNTGVATPGKFDFLHIDEIQSYLTQETRGVYEIKRHDLLYPLLVPLDLEGDKFITVMSKCGSYDTSVMSDMHLNDYRVRYAKSLGEVKFELEYDYKSAKRSALADNTLDGRYTVLPYHDFVQFDIADNKLNMVVTLCESEYICHIDELMYIHCLYLIELATQLEYTPGIVSICVCKAFISDISKSAYTYHQERLKPHVVKYSVLNEQGSAYQLTPKTFSVDYVEKVT